MNDEPSLKGREAIQITLRVNDRPVGDAVIEVGQSVQHTPMHVSAVRENGVMVLRDLFGERVVGTEAVRLREGRVDVSASLVHRFRLPRFIAEQANLVFPLVMAAVTLAGLQIMLLLALFTGGGEGGGPTAPEPSPEYLTRLLNGDYAGADRGVVATPDDRPTGVEPVDSYYLPAGSPGPITKAGGGARVGPTETGDDARPRKSEAAAPVVEEYGKTDQLVPQEAPDDPEGDDLADPSASADGTQTEHAEAVNEKEGWGVTDWYDTEDARKDREEVREAIKLSTEILKLDPDNLYALSIKGYYQYLAMDFPGSIATYNKMIELDDQGGASWNNLALVYKRMGDYEKEEELYRVALMLEPSEPNTRNNLAVCYAHQGRFEEALGLMKRLEQELPDDPYTDLHRAKIYALMGQESKAYRLLEKSLQSMRKMDTLHNIEFQQDIRVDPAFVTMREADRFKGLLRRYYGKRKGAWWNQGG